MGLAFLQNSIFGKWCRRSVQAISSFTMNLIHSLIAGPGRKAGRAVSKMEKTNQQRFGSLRCQIIRVNICDIRNEFRRYDGIVAGSLSALSPDLRILVTPDRQSLGNHDSGRMEAFPARSSGRLYHRSTHARDAIVLPEARPVQIEARSTALQQMPSIYNSPDQSNVPLKISSHRDVGMASEKNCCTTLFAIIWRIY
jgi:hypothetical protein